MVAKDVARFKHAKITASWDIKPKGGPMRLRVQTTLAMDELKFVALNKENGCYNKFWMKGIWKSGTLFLTEKERWCSGFRTKPPEAGW
jgi:hypothetical protein